ncbi:hypothetical protein H6768_02780 [Candidatus Peribacteria bacterium]|nr:hypothetical protein [Candidatus Peribacteria bacterium]
MKELQEAEKKVVSALKEKQEAEIDEALQSIDLNSLDEETRKIIHADTLSK